MPPRPFLRFLIVTTSIYIIFSMVTLVFNGYIFEAYSTNRVDENDGRSQVEEGLRAELQEFKRISLDEQEKHKQSEEEVDRLRNELGDSKKVTNYKAEETKEGELLMHKTINAEIHAARIRHKIAGDEVKRLRPTSDEFKILEVERNSNCLPPLFPNTMSQWMSDYVELHNSATINGKLKDDARFLVYECTEAERCGGLGDRIMFLIRAFFMAMATDRVLLINSTFPVNLEHYLNPHLINWNVTYPSNLPKINEMETYNGVGRDFIHLHMKLPGYKIGKAHAKHSRRLSEILQTHQMKGYLEKSASTHGTPLANLTVASAFHEAFAVLFKFDDNVIARATELKSQANLPREKHEFGHYVGLHHREGDGAMMDEKKETQGSEAFNRYVEPKDTKDCYQTIRSSYPQKNIEAAYIASDNTESKKILQKMDDTIRYPMHLNAFHIDKSSVRRKIVGNKEITVRNDGVTEETIKDGSLDVFAEIAVLASSECLVLSNSMFSFLAYYIRGPDRCSIHVRQCCTNNTGNWFTNDYQYEPGDGKLAQKWNCMHI